jgi:hypothetical protein
MEITGTTELLPYRLVGRELTPDSTVVEVRGRRIGDGFFGLIAGPCTSQFSSSVPRPRRSRST